MELDDLKQAWQQQTSEDIDVRNDKKIIDMIQHKSYGPIAVIKNKLARAFLLIPIMMVVFYSLYSENPDIFQNPLEWYCIGIICVPVLFNAYWYFELNKLQDNNAAIRENLEIEILRFERTLKQYYVLMLFVNIITIILIEIAMSYHKAGEFDRSWMHVPVYLRILIYVGIILLMGFISKVNYQRFFGKHIDYMKDMLRKME